MTKMAKGYLHKISTVCLLELMLVIWCTGRTPDISTNLSTFMKETGWTPPVLETDVSVLLKILQSSPSIQHTETSLFEATFEETIRCYFVRLNCISDEGSTVAFDLLEEALAKIHSLNQNKSNSYGNRSVFLSLVPGVTNASSYHDNLARINAMTNNTVGVISDVLLDLSSVYVGPLDGFSLTQKLDSCNEVGSVRGFRCGFIFNFNWICNYQISVLGHVRFQKHTRIFLNLRKDKLFGTFVLSRLQECLYVIFRNGVKVGGILDSENKIILNSTHFEIEQLAPNRLQNLIPRRISDSSFEYHLPSLTCNSGHKMFYSNISLNKSTSAVISISPNDLYTVLSQDVYVRDNKTYHGLSFNEVFHRFLVIFPSIRDTEESSFANNGSFVSIPALLEAIFQYSKTQKETYHLRPLQLWIAFTPTPEGSIRVELKTVMEYVNKINLRLPGTVKLVLIDYNNLRLDSSSVVSVVKQDVEICNHLVNESDVSCAYIFHSRNCLRNRWLEELPFQDGSLLVLRGGVVPTRKCQTSLRHVHFGSLDLDVLSEDVIEIGFHSKLVLLPPGLLSKAENSVNWDIPIATSGSTNYRIAGKAPYSDNWLHSPLSFSKTSFGFTIQARDLTNTKLVALVTAHTNIVIRINMLSGRKGQTDSDWMSFCPSYSEILSTYKVAILIPYHPTLAENLTSLSDLLFQISTTNARCDEVFNEILIEWDPCLTSDTCTIEHSRDFKSNFAGLANVTKYIEKIKESGLQLGFAFKPESIIYVLVARNSDLYLSERQKTSVCDKCGLDLNQFDSIIYEQILPLSRVLEDGVFRSAMKSIENFENLLNGFSVTTQEVFTLNGPKDLGRIILRVSNCHLLNSTSWNETLEYARFWEILKNWAEQMDVVLIMDIAYQAAGLNECQQEGSDYIEYACGWWTKHDVTGQLVDRKLKGVMMMKNSTKSATNNEQPRSITPTLLIVVPLFLILMAAVSVPLFVHFYRRRYVLKRRVVTELLSDFPSNVDPIVDQASREIIGQGSSKTCVYKCTLKTGDSQLDVAVKSFQATSGDRLQTENVLALRGLISEAKTLRDLKVHKNIVKYLGICTAKLRLGELNLVLEYCPNGSLQNYLPTVFNSADNGNHDSINGIVSKDEIDTLLLKWCSEIANGLEYLASENIVHADIATRNILLDEQMCCKISDFGLSRRMEKYKVYVKTGEDPLPWRWMAPESLRKLIFNEKTDVWMFGVTVWEIYTFGQVPYGGLAWSKDFVKLLDGGLRLEIPSRMPKKVAQLVMACWKLENGARPAFSSCKMELLNE